MPGSPISQIVVHPATAERWPDVEAVMGSNGCSAGCWCMWWRLERSEFKRLQGQGTHERLQQLVEEGRVPGVLAYRDGQPVGRCSIGPREDYLALENSRILRRIDAQPVWSVVCFFVRRGQRGQGVMLELLRGAVRYAVEHGAMVVEGYPIDLQTAQLAGQKLRGVAGYMGIASAFRAAGFEEAGRASETQLIMRLTA